MKKNFIKERIKQIKQFSGHFSMLFENFKVYLKPTMFNFENQKLCKKHFIQ